MNIVLRNPRVGEAAELAVIEKVCWPAAVAAGSRAGTGSLMVNWVPWPRSLWSWIWPLWASMMPLETGRPSPSPPPLNAVLLERCKAVSSKT